MYACMHGPCDFLYACMYACMFACMIVCVYGCMLICLFGCPHICMYLCMSVSMYTCMYVCTYVCMFGMSVRMYVVCMFAYLCLLLDCLVVRMLVCHPCIYVRTYA